MAVRDGASVPPLVTVMSVALAASCFALLRSADPLATARPLDSEPLATARPLDSDLLRVFENARRLEAETGHDLDAAGVAEAANARRPVLWRQQCAASSWGAGGELATRELDRLIPWVSARTLATPEFVLSQPVRGSKPLLRDVQPWEAPLQQTPRNVSVDELLKSSGQSMYYSGTLGQSTTAHWDTDALLSQLGPREHLLLHDTPPILDTEMQPPAGSGTPPQNTTALRLWLSSAGVISRTHYDSARRVVLEPAEPAAFSSDNLLLRLSPSSRGPAPWQSRTTSSRSSSAGSGCCCGLLRRCQPSISTPLS